MKSAIKRFMRLLLTAVVAFSLSAIPAYAAEPTQQEETTQEFAEQSTVITPYWANIASIKPYISVSGGTASITASVSGYSNVTSLKITATIQKQTLWWWDDVKSFSKTIYSSSGTLSDSYAVGSGTFRLKVTVTADSETATVYS